MLNRAQIQMAACVKRKDSRVIERLVRLKDGRT